MAQAPTMNVVGWLRWSWRQLTSMRTALILLFALALAAIPGSVLPQRSISPFDVSQYKTNNPSVAGIYETLGLFNVYSSPWFSAIYLLLFISLIGCIIPRWIALFKALKTPPGRVPTNLARLEGHTSVPLTSAPDFDDAARQLRRSGYRVRFEDGEISAERGIWRELGNLIFHTSLLGMLGALAVSSLWGFRGTAAVIEGGGFANTLSQYDEFSRGGQFNDRNFVPFSVAVDKFSVDFSKDPTSMGTPKDFAADVTVNVDGKARKETVRVNHPLDVHGTAIHLLGHGYAPIVTVTDGSGKVAFSGPLVFLPQDNNFTSKGVIKAPDARPQRLAFEAMFLPTGTIDQHGPRSVFPDAMSPKLVTNVYAGPPKEETGLPENVHNLDKAGLTQVESSPGQPLRANMAVGDRLELPGGQGSLRFDGFKRWTKLQISAQPGMGWALGFLLLAITAMTISLFANARRLYARYREGELQVAGLDRVDGRGGLDDDVRRLTSFLAPHHEGTT